MNDAEKNLNPEAKRFLDASKAGIALIMKHNEIANLLKIMGAKPGREVAPNLDHMEYPTNEEPSQGPPLLGARDFIDFVNDTEPEWALVVVDAPIDEIGNAFTRSYKPAKSWSRVPVQMSEDGDDVESLVVIVQLKTGWTVVVMSIFDVDTLAIKTVREIAKKFAAKLKTKAFSFIGEDTSGAIEYRFYERDQLMEQAEWENGGSFTKFESQLCGEPELDSVDDSFADAFFRRQGVYIPCCYVVMKDDQPCLAVDKTSADWIERADVFDLSR